MTQKKNELKSFIQDFFIAGVAGALPNLFMTPVFNVNLSINRSIRDHSNLKVSKINQRFLTHAQNIIKQKGIKQLCKVNFKALINSFYFQAISFSFKNTLQKLFNFTKLHDGFLRTFFANTVSGMIGGIIALTLVFPFNYPRVMLAQMKGLKDFYKNFSSYLIPGAVYRGLYFGIFDSIKTNSQDKKIDSLCQIFVYSVSSTLTAQILAAPFQTAQIKILTQKKPRNLKFYFEMVKKQSTFSILKCLQFKFPFVYRTGVGASILTLYEKLVEQFSSY